MERALVSRGDLKIEKIWRAFELNPGMPDGGMDRKLYIQAKFGSWERAERLYDTIAMVGALEDIHFRFDLIKRTPNTMAAHTLLKVARTQAKEEVLLLLLFEAYFEKGLDIGTAEVLQDLARQVELEPYPSSAQSFYIKQVEQDLAMRDLIGGVPHYIFDGKYSLAGAQEPEILLRLFDLARVEEQSLLSF